MINIKKISLQLRNLALSDLDESDSFTPKSLSLEKGEHIINKIKGQNPYKFLSFILHTFSSFNLTYMFLYIPFIWEEVKIVDIKNLFNELSENQKYEGIVALMSFLSRYIEIDSMVIFENTDLQNTEIRNIILLNRESFTSSVLNIKKHDIEIKETFKKHLFMLEGVKERLILEGASEFHYQKPIHKASFLKKILKNLFP